MKRCPRCSARLRFWQLFWMTSWSAPYRCPECHGHATISSRERIGIAAIAFVLLIWPAFVLGWWVLLPVILVAPPLLTLAIMQFCKFEIIPDSDGQVN